MARNTVGFEAAMRMMRSRDGATQEDGFHALLPVADQYLAELANELRTEPDPGLCAWLCELLASTRSDGAVAPLTDCLSDARERVADAAAFQLESMNTRASRTALWAHRNASDTTDDRGPRD